MKNITLAVDEEVLAKVRRRAAAAGVSVNALVREHLGRLADQDDAEAEARKALLELARNSTARMGPDYKWNREELYDREALRRHEHPDLRSDRKSG